MPDIKLSNGKKIPFLKKIDGFEIAKKISQSLSKEACVMSVNGALKDLSFTINDGGVTKTPLTFAGSTGNITLTGNTTITGNLSITGEFENTSSVIITVDDVFVKVNTGISEVDAGLIVKT